MIALGTGPSDAYEYDPVPRRRLVRNKAGKRSKNPVTLVTRADNRLNAQENLVPKYLPLSDELMTYVENLAPPEHPVPIV